MPNHYDNTPDDLIVKDILDMEEKVSSIKSSIALAKNALIERKKTEIQTALSEKKEPFGAVSTEIANKKVTFTTPKKVDWDQNGLASVHKQMLTDGTDPLEYMSIEYKIEENKYKNWPSNIKEYFEPYRTLQPGNVAVKIEELKEK